jgi:hypothetical protein
MAHVPDSGRVFCVDARIEDTDAVLKRFARNDVTLDVTALDVTALDVTARVPSLAVNRAAAARRAQLAACVQG